MTEDCFVGIDFGTSGCRAIAVDRHGAMIAQVKQALPAPAVNGASILQDPAIWWDACGALLDALVTRLNGRSITGICVDGTSGTVLATDGAGTPLGPARLYNDADCVEEASRIALHAPAASGAHGPSSGLAKAMRLLSEHGPSVRWILTQADWIAGRLAGRFGVSDENNALKLGYDPIRRRWPNWLANVGVPTACLPRAFVPGAEIGPLAAEWMPRWNQAISATIRVGTTDSVAAFVAACPQSEGIGVTSLGSTLVLKVLAKRPLFAPQFGIYSHRLGDDWLVGGASNSGGAVLRQYFSQAQIDELTTQLQPSRPTNLNYYPLPRPGERFPVSDPNLQPRLTPRPTDDRVFFQGMLEGIAEIERRGYALLAELGAPYPQRVLSVGGGAQNSNWLHIRQRVLEVPVSRPDHDEAAYGSALLALWRA